MFENSVELRVPIEGTLIINSIGGLMKKQDRRTKNGGKTKGKRLTAVVKKAAAGVDTYEPGQPFTIAKSLKGKWEVKASKVPFVCVTKNCTGKTKARKGKWCDECFPKVRAITMKVNKARWNKKQAKKAA